MKLGGYGNEQMKEAKVAFLTTKIVRKLFEIFIIFDFQLLLFIIEILNHFFVSDFQAEIMVEQFEVCSLEDTVFQER